MRRWSKTFAFPLGKTKLLELFLCLAPLFLVTIRWWSSFVLIVGAIGCFSYLCYAKKSFDPRIPPDQSGERLIVFMLLAPMLAVEASALLRSSHVLANYDSPSRFLVAIAIFRFAVQKRTNAALYLQYVAPASLFLTLLHQVFMNQPKLWGEDRMATYFADPLTFGYTALTLALISLFSIHLLGKDSLAVRLLKASGALTGVYLSVMSGSRTGWLAFPVVITVWACQQKFAADKHRRMLIIVGATALMLGLYFTSNTVQQRLMLGVHEAINYSWVGLAPETSIGLRITFLRIANDMFHSSPLAGFGDNGYDLTALPQQIRTYASSESLRMAFTAGFHNEIVSNAVRFGMGGMIAAAMLFFVPMTVFFRQSRTDNKVRRANALIGLVVTICFFVSSLSTEVFDLKYMASLYAVLVALLCASAITAAGNPTGEVDS